MDGLAIGLFALTGLVAGRLIARVAYALPRTMEEEWRADVMAFHCAWGNRCAALASGHDTRTLVGDASRAARHGLSRDVFLTCWSHRHVTEKRIWPRDPRCFENVARIVSACQRR